MLGLIKNALVIFFKKIMGTEEPSVPLSSEPQIMTTHAYVYEPEAEEPRRQYDLRVRKNINYAEDSD
jgi:hypothetical protein